MIKNLVLLFVLAFAAVTSAADFSISHFATGVPGVWNFIPNYPSSGLIVQVTNPAMLTYSAAETDRKIVVDLRSKFENVKDAKFTIHSATCDAAGRAEFSFLEIATVMKEAATEFGVIEIEAMVVEGKGKDIKWRSEKVMSAYLRNDKTAAAVIKDIDYKIDVQGKFQAGTSDVTIQQTLADAVGVKYTDIQVTSNKVASSKAAPLKREMQALATCGAKQTHTVTFNIPPRVGLTKLETLVILEKFLLKTSDLESDAAKHLCLSSVPDLTSTTNEVLSVSQPLVQPSPNQAVQSAQTPVIDAPSAYDEEKDSDSTVYAAVVGVCIFVGIVIILIVFYKSRQKKPSPKGNEPFGKVVEDVESS